MAALAAPAHAATGDTTVALTVVDGTLAIVTTPAATGVSSQIVGTGRVLTSPLGVTTITDTRAASSGWTLTATTTSFTHSVTASEVIPSANAKFSLAAAPTTVLGTATYTYTASPDSSGDLAVASATGINTATVEPVLTVDVPAAAITGLYTGTVTQSVV